MSTRSPEDVIGRRHALGYRRGDRCRCSRKRDQSTSKSRSRLFPDSLAIDIISWRSARLVCIRDRFSLDHARYEEGRRNCDEIDQLA
jgi:hypothetical protein